MSVHEPCSLIGVMSGTSLDAIDAAWVEFSASGKPKLLDFESSPISAALRTDLMALQTAA
ncbi:MAG: anhydro-N-acetylmuramic acid kinase, partial [Betaproteobacteria bacterium]|nr:anhydro-N-acetylmuramic acid kinase [Betaproteobacteria bacterium]